MTRVYLGLGSNLGDRRKNIKQALSLLRKENIKIKKLSKIIETLPVGGPPQGKFLNAVLEIETDYPPRELLLNLKRIERKIGRKRTVRFGPRKIDLDILLYGERKVNQPGLVIPHPGILERDFVMRPLREIAPDIARKIRLRQK